MNRLNFFHFKQALASDRRPAAFSPDGQWIVTATTSVMWPIFSSTSGVTGAVRRVTGAIALLLPLSQGVIAAFRGRGESRHVWAPDSIGIG